MQRFLMALLAVGVAALSGCGTARYVEKNAESGIIAIPSNADFWPMKHRTEAIALIEKHVGPAYEIVEEKEVVTGVTTHHNQEVTREPTYNSEVPFLGAEKQTVTNSTSTSDTTEWRIAYRRRPVPATNGIQPAGGVVPTGPVVPAGGVRTTNKPADCKQ